MYTNTQVLFHRLDLNYDGVLSSSEVELGWSDALQALPSLQPRSEELLAAALSTTMAKA